MFFSYIVLLGSLVNLLLDSPASFVAGCDRNCTDKPEFTPSSLVVKYGDQFSASCLVCKTDCIGSYFGLEVRLGVKETNGTILSWKVDKMTQWSSSAKCYYNDVKVAGHQCCADLPIMVYRAPDNVSLRILNHTDLLIEGNQYTLECMVQNVAPVKYLVVTFYKGSTALSQMQSNNTKVNLVNENFFLNINSSKEDDGVQYHCAAELNLGIDPNPLVINSQRISVTVHYKPRLVAPSNPDPVDVKEGDPLELNCLAVGQPSPSYTWTLPQGVTFHTNDSVLTIKSATTTNKGEYTCIVNNSMGSVTVSFSVNVHADIIGYILIGILFTVAVLFIFGVAVYCSSWRRNRMGTYSFLRPFLSRN